MSPMTLAEALAQIDALCPNAFTPAEKTRWLSEADGLVYEEILKTHEGAEQVTFTGYDAAADTAVRLLVPPPYDGLYHLYAEAQMHGVNGEITRCNNAREGWNNAFMTYEAFYNRTHRPLAPNGVLKLC